MDVFAAARGFLIDLDGTLVSGGAALPGAAALLERLAGRFVLVSNDAEHTPRQLAAQLRRLGLAVPADRILLAGAAALDPLARERPGARILLLGSAALHRQARRRGLVPLDRGEEGVEAVVLCRDRGFTYGRLERAAHAVRGGAALVVANPDLVHPGPGGRVVPETGALLQALLACTGPMPYRLVGKPEPGLFLAGLARLGLAAEETVMVGDNPATDGTGARRLGIGFLQAGPGGPAAWGRAIAAEARPQRHIAFSPA